MKRPGVILFLSFLLLSGTALLWGLRWIHPKVESRLSRALHAPVKVERISLSPKGLTLHGVTLELPQPPLRIERLQLAGWLPNKLQSIAVRGLTIWLGGVPLRAQGRVHLSAPAQGQAQADGWLTVDHPMVRGWVELTGPVSSPIVLGWVELSGEKKHFIGQLDLNPNEIGVSRMEIQGGWRLAGSLSMGKPWAGDLELAAGQDRFRVQIRPEAPNGARATAWIVREGFAAHEITARWTVPNGHVDLQVDFPAAGMFLKGIVQLKKPYLAELDLTLKGMELAEWADWLLPGWDPSKLSGLLEGQVHFSGPLEKVTSSGELLMGTGRFGPMQFDRLAIRFQGTGPILRIDNSQIMRNQSPLFMNGLLDVRRVGQPDFFRNVKLTARERNLEVAGWLMGMSHTSPGLQVKRAGGGDAPMTVGLNYEVDTAIPQEPVERRELEVEYPLTSEERVSIKLQEQEQFFGLEHRKKF